jgi:drug/metabolite transporter (DMT)-like permease
MTLSAVVLGVMAPLIDGWRSIDWTPSLVALMLYSALPGTVLAFWASAVTLGEAPTLSLGIAVALIIGGIALGAVEPAPLQSPPRSDGVSPYPEGGRRWRKAS